VMIEAEAELHGGQPRSRASDVRELWGDCESRLTELTTSNSLTEPKVPERTKDKEVERVEAKMIRARRPE